MRRIQAGEFSWGVEPICYFGGGSAGGGGGSSGTVQWPDYFMGIHHFMLDAGGANHLNNTMYTLLNSAWNNNPFLYMTAYDPTSALTGMFGYITNLGNVAIALSWNTSINSYMSNAVSLYDSSFAPESYIANDAAAYNDTIDEEIETGILPRFQRGMQNINAVQSSSFVIGESLIEAAGLIRKTQYLAQLRMQSYKDRTQFILGAVELSSKLNMAQLEMYRNAVTLAIEGYRMFIVAHRECIDQLYRIAEAAVRWPLEVMQYGANVLAAGHGGVAVPKSNEVNTGASVLGGALSGASAGAAAASALGASGPMGWAVMGIGAIIGGLAGLFS